MRYPRAPNAKWNLLYTRLRKGYIPSVAKSRNEIITKFLTDFKRVGMSERDLVNKSAKELAMILLQLCYDKLYAVPFQLVTFDIKYLDNPRFTPEGPTSCIAEIAAYHPESGRMFERLVTPSSTAFQPAEPKCGTEPAISQIPMSMIAKYGVSFSVAWAELLEWLSSLPDPVSTVTSDSLDGKGTFSDVAPNLELDEGFRKELLPSPIETNKHLLLSFDRASSGVAGETGLQALDTFNNNNKKVLLISHGGRLADVSMLKWESKKVDMSMPRQITFGDSFGIIKERHRRRPVTMNKLPAMWDTKALSLWMALPQYEELAHHNALSDAICTWEILEETLRRYGVENLTAKQQLGEIFFKSALDTVTQTGTGIG